MDERPPIWVGHTAMTVRDAERSCDFWTQLGLRPVHRSDEISILEMRGGTHLLLFPGEPETPADAPFDLMVDDLDATHERFAAEGLDVSDIQRGDIHDSFTVTDPDGYRLGFSNSHVEGVV